MIAKIMNRIASTLPIPNTDAMRERGIAVMCHMRSVAARFTRQTFITCREFGLDFRWPQFAASAVRAVPTTLPASPSFVTGTAKLAISNPARPTTWPSHRASASGP